MGSPEDTGGSASASSASSSPAEISLLTLNCWAIRHISSLIQPRIAHIARLLADPPAPSSSSTLSAASGDSSGSSPRRRRQPDIVCLQELFTQDDYQTLRRETRNSHPYGKFFHAGAFGAGLVILSRWPIDESSTHPYPLNGRPTAFWRGDWYVGKGVARARIRFGPDPARDVLDVFNTHTHSPYERGADEDGNAYLCHRLAQSWELAKLVRASARAGHLVAVLGDFNMLPHSLPHRIVTAHAPLRDAWLVLHPDSALGPANHPSERARRRPLPSAAFNLSENGATSNNVLNTWRWDKDQLKKLRSGSPCDVDPAAPDPRGQRLDYIFVSTGQRDGPSSPGWVVKSAAVTFTDRHPEHGVSLSDHFAVQATITRHTPAAPPAPPAPTALRPVTPSTPLPTPSVDALRSGAFLAPPDSPSSRAPSTLAVPDADFDAQLHYPATHTPALSLGAYDEILSLIHKYTAREERERYWRGLHFYAAIAIWIGCLVGVCFTPRWYASFILMFFGSLNLVAGTIDGLLSLLFFNSELRALKEFEWEIRNAKAAASGELVALADTPLDRKS